ncbi:MAG: FAD-dependent monooxygenase [Coriobacteriia bacterium]|nr:FAD-dependent monooxygenase [Coriobacteriia bacterium]
MDTTNLPNSFDTVVVGAGPAGVMAALHAAERGSVLLTDASRLPRDKSCGGMLNEYTQGFLSEFGTLPPEMALEPNWVNFRYHDWDRGIRKPTALRFANVDRSSFDDWLVGLLPGNVTVIGNSQLTGFNEDSEGVRATLRTGGGNGDGDGVDRTVSCENLIGCDGPRSTVRRALGVGSVATYVTLQDFCTIEGEIEPYFDCIYMRHIGDSFAYAYVVPKGDVAIVGAVFYPKTKRPYEKHEEALQTLRQALPLGESVKREAWVALSVRHARDVVPGRGRVLLAGEAGGFMSPTSGEGISYALNTGRLAGIAVGRHDPARALGAYAEATSAIASNITRKLKWLPFMESRTGKYLAGFVPTPVVSHVTKGL